MYYNLLLLTKLLKIKSFSYLDKCIKGKSTDANRISNNKCTIYQHLNYLLTEPTYIIDNIYLGNALNALNINTLSKYGIEAVINITEEIPNNFPNIITYLNISVGDNTDSYIVENYEIAYKFINLYSNKKILIHCYMGSSRSVSLVIYYLMKHNKYTFTEAYQFLKNKRSFVNINVNFKNEILTHFSNLV